MTDPPDAAAQRLQRVAVEMAAMAQAGLTYVRDRYDQKRNERLRELAAEVLAVVGSSSAAELTLMLDRDEGHPTPKVDVRGAVFDQDRVLLVREASDGGWTLPGGWADPLEPPRLAVEREFAEEAGMAVRSTRLAAVWDGSIHNAHPAVPWHIYKLFFLCERLDSADPVAGLDGETTDVEWFALDDLPALSQRRVTSVQLHRLFEHTRDPSLPVDVD